MKKKIILLGALVVSSLAYSQVGINTETPKATLDVSAKTPSTAAEGIIAPRLSGDDIKGKDGQYLADQKGAIVYATSAVNTPSIKTANITAEGYYYFDGSIWIKFNTAGTDDWHVTGNAGTNPIGTVPTLMGATNNYVGTKDAQNLVLGVNGISRAIITTTGSFYGGAGAVDNGTLEAANTVTGIGSFVWGSGNSATGNLVSIFGRANSTTSSSTNIYGNSNVITGSNSVNTFVTGNTNTVNNFQGSLVNGKNNIINYTAAAGSGVMGDGGNLVSGKENNLSGPTTPAGIVLGGFRNTVASSVSNIATFGESNTVNSANTLVAGKGNTVNANMTNAAVVGTYNTPVDNSLFIVGNGVSGTTKNAVVVLNNGNVGIGTNAPGRPLEIERATTVGPNSGIMLTEYVGAVGDKGAQINLRSSRGSKGGEQPLQNGDVIASYLFDYYSPTGFTNGDGSKIMSNYLGDGTNRRNDLRFFTTASTTAAEKMRLDPDGNLGIGTGSPTNKLHVTNPTAGAVRIVDGTQQAGRVLTSDANGVGTWQALSMGNKTAVVHFSGTQSIANTSVVGATASKENLTGSIISNDIGAGVSASSGNLNLQAGKYMIFITHDVDAGEYCIFEVKRNDGTSMYQTYYGEMLNTSFLVDMPSDGFISFYALGLVGTLNPSPTYYLQAADYTNVPINNHVTVLKLN